MSEYSNPEGAEPFSAPPLSTATPEALNEAREALATARKTARSNFDPDLKAVPKGMKSGVRWVMWGLRIKWNDDGTYTLDKVPFRAVLGKRLHAASNDRATWSTLKVALTVLKADWTLASGGIFDGLGYCFSESGFTAVDLDHIIRDGVVVAPWAQELLSELAGTTYMERSILGEGLHIVAHEDGNGNGGKRFEFNDGSAAEIYPDSSPRYLTISGQLWDGGISTIGKIDGPGLLDRFERGELGPPDFRAERAAEAEKAVSEAAQHKFNGEAFDVAGFLKRHSDKLKPSKPKLLKNGGSVWEVVCSGTHEGHAKDDGKAYVLQRGNGAVFAGCHHKKHCSWAKGNHWKELRQMLEPSGDPPVVGATGRIRPQPQYHPNTGKLIAPIAVVGNTLLADDFFARNEGEKLYRFNHGTYHDNGTMLVRTRSKWLMEQWTGGDQWTKSFAGNVEEWVLLESPTLWESPPLDRVNLLNGIYDLTTGKLEPHSHTWLSPIQLPIKYDPNGRCPAWNKFLHDAAPADVYEEEVIFQLAALLMIPCMSAQRALLLMGERGTGKSRLLAALRAFLGVRNVSTKSLHQLEENRFASAYLYGKLANIFADLPARHLETTSTFKQVTGEDYIDGEYKHGAQFHFKPFCRLLFSANRPPQSKDASGAFLDRWWVFPFTHRFEGTSDQVSAEVLDATLANASELSGVLNRALEYVPRVIEQHGITITDSMREAHDQFCAVTDPFRVWLAQCVIDDTEAICPCDDAYRSYQEFRKERRAPLITVTAFGLEFKCHKPKTDCKQRTVGVRLRWCYIGIRLRERPPSEGKDG